MAIVRGVPNFRIFTVDSIFPFSLQLLDALLHWKPNCSMFRTVTVIISDVLILRVFTLSFLLIFSDNNFYVPDSQSMVKSSKARDTRLSSGSAIVCSHGTPLTNFPVTSMLPLGDVSTVLHTGRGGTLNSSSSKWFSSASVMLGSSECQMKRRLMKIYQKKLKHCNTIKILF